MARRSTNSRRTPRRTGARRGSRAARRRHRRVVAGVAITAALVLGGGGAALWAVGRDDSGHGAAGPSGATPTTASTPAPADPGEDVPLPEPSTTSSAAPASTSTTPPAEPDPLTDPTATIAPGDEGEAVRLLQERLLALGYWMPGVDGRYGPSTAHAVTAFQKVEGLGRDGVAGPETRARLDVAGRPAAADPGVAGRALEVDLARQVTFVLADGAVEWALDVSTGTSSTPTRPGRFTIDRQIDGLRISDLGRLWRPKYFDGGIAFHGSPSVPPYPASHGCVRMPNPTIDWLWDASIAPVGTPVHVY